MASVAESDIGRLQDEFLCSICHDYFREPVIASCGHNFCQSCITVYLNQCKGNRPCPLCRQEFADTVPIPNTQLGKTTNKVKQLLWAFTKGQVGDSEDEQNQDTVTSFSEELGVPIRIVCNASRDHSSDVKVLAPHPIEAAEYESMVVKNAGERHEEDLWMQEKNRHAHQNGKFEKEKWAHTKVLSAFRKVITKAGFCIVFTSATSVLAVLILLVIALSAILAVSVKKSNQYFADWQQLRQTAVCPADWIGYRGRCFYFSETEGNWNFSKSNCSSFHASLVGIDTRTELVFLERYKGLGEHWIGLWREEKEQSWKWADGRAFTNQFELKGRGTCAYLSDGEVRTTRCHLEKKWICSKP